MANTNRTRSQLLALWPDNILGQITAQDGRDFITSAFGYLGSRSPTANDDNVNTGGTGAYFDAGNVWVDTVGGEFWFCLSGAPGAAVWLRRCCSSPLAPVTISGGGSTDIPLTIIGASGQSVDLLEIKSFGGTTYVSVGSAGATKIAVNNATVLTLQNTGATGTIDLLEFRNSVNGLVGYVQANGVAGLATLLLNYTNITTNTTLSGVNNYVTVDATSGNITITLPLTTGQGKGRILWIKKIDSTANTVTVQRTSPDVIDGATSVVLTRQYQWLGLFGDNGGNWSIITSGYSATGGGSGTVTSVGLTSTGGTLTITGSPVTSSGNINADLAAQAANTVLAGPASGGPAVPAPRALGNADLPTGTPKMVKFTVTAAQIAALGAVTSATVTLTLPTNGPIVILKFWMETLAGNAFSGTGLTGLSGQPWINVSSPSVGTSQPIMNAGSKTEYTCLSSATTIFWVNVNGTTTDVLGFRVTSTGANLSVVTGGPVTLWMQYVDLPGG